MKQRIALLLYIGCLLSALAAVVVSAQIQEHPEGASSIVPGGVPAQSVPAQGSPAATPLTVGGGAPYVEPAATAVVPVERADGDVVSTVKASKEEIEKGVRVSSGSERISLDLKGIDIVELFRILSMKMGITIVPSKSVGGRVNIYLNNLTFEDALDVILLSQDLACENNGHIINIMTSGEYEKLYGKKYNEKRKYESLKLVYAKPANVFNAVSQVKSDIGKVIVDESTGTILLIDIPEKLELIKKTIAELDRPPQTEIFELQYAKPADIKTQLSSAVTTGPGELYVDERSNKVIVTDLPEKMKKIKRMVKALDETSRQVFIEAEILQITLKDEYQQGINWEKVISKIDGLDLKGTFPVAPSFTPSPALTTASMKMVVGSLADNTYTTTLQMLQTYGDTKILSRPRIAAISGQEAKILIGSREAYVTQTLSQGDTTTVTSENVQFIDVGVKLDVVPTINKEGFVMMKIKPEVSSVRETLTTALGSVIPIVETSEAETSIKVKDGTMIMIAGLMKDDKRRDTTGIPLLSKIPLIGGAFRSTATQKKTTELVVFLTPHIISGDATVSGTEFEKMIPADIVPDDIEESIVARKVKEIELEGMDKLTPREQGEQKYVPDKAKKSKEQIQDKMKGVQEY